MLLVLSEMQSRPFSVAGWVATICCWVKADMDPWSGSLIGGRYQLPVSHVLQVFLRSQVSCFCRNLCVLGRVELMEQNKRTKVLCLHGFRTSGSFLKKRISKWHPSIFQQFEMVLCWIQWSGLFGLLPSFLEHFPLRFFFRSSLMASSQLVESHW